jgi:putative ABC transport system permease protein
MIKYALQIVSRRKLRTFLTSLGVTISVVLLSFIIFGMQGLDKMLTNEFTSRFRPNEIFLTQQQDFGFLSMTEMEDDDEEEEEEALIMNDTFLDEIKTIEGVDTVRGVFVVMNLQIQVENYTKKMENAIISGWDAYSADPILGTFVAGDETLEDGCVYISKRVSSFYNEEPEELLNKNVTLSAFLGSMYSLQTKGTEDKEYTYNICGVFDIGMDRNDLVLTSNDAKELLADLGGFDSGDEYTQNIGYNQVSINATGEEMVPKIKEQIEDEYGILALTSDDLLSFLGDITKALTFALLLFAIVSAIVASVGIINTMIMSIYEQTREIGIIKAIGSSNLQVLGIFLIQSAFIGFLGGFLGLAIVYTGMYISDPYLVEILRDNNFNIEQFFYIDWGLTIIIIISSITVGIIAGIYPSIKAAKLDPVKALSFE